MPHAPPKNVSIVFPPGGLMPGPRPERLGGYFMTFDTARELAAYLGFNFSTENGVDWDNSFLPVHFENHFVEKKMLCRAAVLYWPAESKIGGLWLISSFVNFAGTSDPGPLPEATDSDDVDRAVDNGAFRAWLSEYKMPDAVVQRNDCALRAWLRECRLPDADVQWVSLEDTSGITVTGRAPRESRRKIKKLSTNAEVNELLRESTLAVQAAKAKYFAELRAKALAENKS